MAMKRCNANLHFYDSDKHNDCPYCRQIDDNVSNTDALGQTVGNTIGDIEKTQGEFTSPVGSSQDNLDSGPTISGYDPSDLDGSKTIGIYQTPEGENFEPVVGWLVCIDGPNKGRDYKIYARSSPNFIAREPGRNTSIVISGDGSISREKHASIIYDQDDNSFTLTREESTAIKVGTKKVKVAEELSPYDEITLGTSKFHFVPYCAGEIKWQV